MGTRALLAAFLLSVGLCLVPVMGHGEVNEAYLVEITRPHIDFVLLEATVRYIMFNPADFLVVMCSYDPFGSAAKKYPVGVKTKGRIDITIKDNRGIFFGKYGRALLNQFKKELEAFYPFIKYYVTDIDTDIVAIFMSVPGSPLGYFYQGEYHLWEK